MQKAQSRPGESRLRPSPAVSSNAAQGAHTADECWDRSHGRRTGGIPTRSGIGRGHRFATTSSRLSPVRPAPPSAFASASSLPLAGVPIICITPVPSAVYRPLVSDACIRIVCRKMRAACLLELVRPRGLSAVELKNDALRRSALRQWAASHTRPPSAVAGQRFRHCT